MSRGHAELAVDTAATAAIEQLNLPAGSLSWATIHRASESLLGKPVRIVRVDSLEASRVTGLWMETPHYGQITDWTGSHPVFKTFVRLHEVGHLASGHAGCGVSPELLEALGAVPGVDEAETIQARVSSAGSPFAAVLGGRPAGVEDFNEAVAEEVALRLMRRLLRVPGSGVFEFFR